ncbi:MAG TPA: hypothetical protein VKB09_05760 [Thermomicrobiales bacterium]|nr:hypothetical protein [Thermomicrobiales bacterium]
METSRAVGLGTPRFGARLRLILAIAGLAVLATTGVFLLNQSVRSEERVPGSSPATSDVPSHDAMGAMAGVGHEASMVVVPAAPTDGVVSIVIPPGTDAAMRRSGDAGYHMPSVMRLQVGDTIVIRNDDSVPHMILYTFLLPGQSDRRTFTTDGSEAYSSGCAANAAEFLDFTTIFVVDR